MRRLHVEMGLVDDVYRVLCVGVSKCKPSRGQEVSVPRRVKCMKLGQYREGLFWMIRECTHSS